MSRKLKRVAKSTECDPPKEEDVKRVTTGNDFSGLPNEVILKILSNLSHGDQVWARLVCTRWNEIISIDPTFRDKSVLRVSIDTNNRVTILKNSVVKWRHLNLKDLRSSGLAPPIIIIPLYLRNEIQTVKISDAEVTWKGLQEILIQFPSLQGLKISRSGITSPSKGWKPSHSKLQLEFETILRGLSSLALSRLRRGVMDIFLDQFMAKLPVLATLEIKCERIWFPMANANRLFKFIESVAPTLKNLCIVIQDLDPHGTIKLLVREVLQRLNESEFAKISLNLETFFLHYDGSYSYHNTDDLRTLIDFLKMNKNLKRICCLPEYNSSLTTDLALEFVGVLPRGLQEIYVPSATYLSVQGNFFRLFEKMESIQVRPHIRPFQLNLDGQVLPTVHVYENCLLLNTLDIKLVVHAFPNLVKLKAKIISTEHSSGILQEICRHMKLLVSLDLILDCKITDSAVTGISWLYCKQLRQSPAASLVSIKGDPIPEKHVTGLQLSSLRRLEKLSIQAYTMKISNVGLCFGFRFPGLKKLSLACIGDRQRNRITPAGLSFIADYNRNLQEVTLRNIVRVNCSDVLGTEAIKTFENRLDRCKSFRIWITWDPPFPQPMWSHEESSNLSGLF